MHRCSRWHSPSCHEAMLSSSDTLSRLPWHLEDLKRRTTVPWSILERMETERKLQNRGSHPGMSWIRDWSDVPACEEATHVHPLANNKMPPDDRRLVSDIRGMIPEESLNIYPLDIMDFYSRSASNQTPLHVSAYSAWFIRASANALHHDSNLDSGEHLSPTILFQRKRKN